MSDGRQSRVSIGAALALRLSIGLSLGLCLGAASAQNAPSKIWDIKLGTAIAALPLDNFVDPACGTNGGPPARVLKGFAEFAQCAVERTTGLREVWFRYDDEMEYVARARRSEIMVRQYRANSLAGQPIITSLLIDGAGLVQGYRIVNDPRIESNTRIAAFGLADVFKGIAGMGLQCTDLPLAEGERPILIDFGMASLCGVENRIWNTTLLGGSLHYMPPERLTAHTARRPGEINLVMVLIEQRGGEAD